MKLNRKNINVLIILVAVINIILATVLFVRDIAWEFYTHSFMIVVVLQILVISISNISIKSIDSIKSKKLMIFSIIILLITFFIPIQMNLDRSSSSSSGLSPTVMPKECKQNIYKITIYSNN